MGARRLAWWVVVALAVAVATPVQAQDAGPLALVGGTIYPSPVEAPIPDGVVLIEGSTIAAVGARGAFEVPPNARVLDCAGRTVTAGFWNMHVHFTEIKWLGAARAPAAQLESWLRDMLLRYGFVHVVDTGSLLDVTLGLKRRIEAGELSGPSIRTTGPGFVRPGGSPFYIAPAKLPELESASRARELVAQRIAAGAGAIKLFTATAAAADEPPATMPVELATAAVEAAHAAGVTVIAHPSTNGGIETALVAGVDVLAHTSPDGGEVWSGDLIARMRAGKMAVVPTLKLWTWELERKQAAPDVVERFTDIAVAQVRAYAEAGGEILFGTDVGYMTDYDPTREYLLLDRAGLDARSILAALTVAPATRFGSSERTGRIAPGLDADLVVLDGDPSQDATAWARVRHALRAGEVVYSSGQATAQ